MEIKVLDSTLREGRQSLFFQEIDNLQQEYLGVASRLGVIDFEIRNPLNSSTDYAEYQKLILEYPNLNYHIHIFLNVQNVNKLLLDESITNVSTFILSPVSDYDLNLLRRLLSSNKKIRVAIEKSPLLNRDILTNIINFLMRYGADRIGFSDTNGDFTPDSITDFLSFLENFNLEKTNLEFHLHNDLGLAAANAFTILKNIKKIKSLYLSVSMFGIGDRNGILSYGDLISNMIRLNKATMYEFRNYGSLVKLFESSGLIFNRDPLSSVSFYHFASSHISGALNNKKYQNIDHDLVGMKPNFVFNKDTDSYVFNEVANHYLQHRFSHNDKEIKYFILKALRKQRKNFFLLEEVIDLLRTYKE